MTTIEKFKQIVKEWLENNSSMIDQSTRSCEIVNGSKVQLGRPSFYEPTPPKEKDE